MRSRVALLVVALALPIIGLVVLLVQPNLDVVWQHHPAHFWLVLAAAAVSFGLAYTTGSTARRRNDARVFLVSLAFLSAAGFLGLHALATPGVLLEGQNAGFTLATPIGLLVASMFAAASSLPLGPDHATVVMRHAALLRWLLVAVMAGWAVISLLELPPLEGMAPPERASGPLVVLSGSRPCCTRSRSSVTFDCPGILARPPC
jgi:adenylate cyclase